MRGIVFRAWVAVLVVVFGIGFFGLTTLVIGWFESLEGVAGPVTDLGYGALVGIILTLGLLVQLRAPERKIAALQQAVLVISALVIGSAIAWDSQNLIPALILLPTLTILLALHPARSEFQMAAMAIAVLLTGLLAALRTKGGGSRSGVQGWPPSFLGLPRWPSRIIRAPRGGGGRVLRSRAASSLSPWASGRQGNSLGRRETNKLHRPRRRARSMANRRRERARAIRCSRGDRCHPLGAAGADRPAAPGCDYSAVAVLGKARTRGARWRAAGLAAHGFNSALFGLAHHELRRRFPVGPRKLALGMALAEHLSLFPLCYLVDRFHPARR